MNDPETELLLIPQGKKAVIGTDKLAIAFVAMVVLNGLMFQRITEELSTLKQQKAMVAYVAHEYASLNKTCVTACHLKGE